MRGKVKGPPEVNPFKMNRADVFEHVSIDTATAFSPPDIEEQYGLSDVSAEGVTILLVEDDPAVQEAAQFLLEGYGYRVITANSGADSLRQLLPWTPEAALRQWVRVGT